MTERLETAGTVWDGFAPELFTDLYEFTMGESYLREGMCDEACFSLFIRAYPRGRSYFVSAGLEHLVDLVTGLRFREESVAYLASLGKFSPEFLDYLRNFRFTGTIRAIPEGRIFFADEPVVEVTAPIIEGQLIETLVMNTIQLETMIASKAARCVHAAAGKPLVDFSFRRTQGVEAGLKVARASYIAGFLGTSNVLAGKLYGIPVYGTMAHSYVTSFSSELESFMTFARTFPDNSVLLIDTYDTLCGAAKAVEVARAMAAEGRKLQGVRLDSGDLVELSRAVRDLLLREGFPDVRIMASGSLDEYRLAALNEAGAEIDIYAVGTRLGVSADAPYLDVAYKLVQYGKRPILKLSSGKKSWVGKKQVYRLRDSEGFMKEDRLCLMGELEDQGEPLLETVVENGKRVRPEESLAAIQQRFTREWATVPEELRSIFPLDAYPVRASAALRELDDRTTRERMLAEVKGAC